MSSPYNSRGTALPMTGLHRHSTDFIVSERPYVLVVRPSKPSPAWLGTKFTYVMNENVWSGISPPTICCNIVNILSRNTQQFTDFRDCFLFLFIKSSDFVDNFDC